jgi:D-ribose pyranose/furanose isomerase RbsD
MERARMVCFLSMVLFLPGCAWMGSDESPWKSAVNRRTGQMGFRNWIVVAEASFPAFGRVGVHQVPANVEIPEALDYVLNAIEQTQHVKPNIYLTRELRSLKNDEAPGVDQLREQLQGALHGMETTSLEQESLMTLLQDANRSFDVLIIRTTSALPYSSVFIELQPGYWDAEAEQQLRDRMDQERLKKMNPDLD